MPSIWKAPRLTLKDIAEEADHYWSPRQEAYLPNMSSSMATRLDDQLFRSFTFRLASDFYFSRWNKQKANEIEKLALLALATSPQVNTRIKPENVARHLKLTVFDPSAGSSMPGRYWGERKYPGMVRDLIEARDLIKGQFPDLIEVIDWLNQHIVAVDTIRETTEDMVRKSVKAGLKKLDLDDPSKYGGPRRTKLSTSAAQRVAAMWVGRLASDLSAPENVGSKRGAELWIRFLRQHILGFPQGPKRNQAVAEATNEVKYAAFLFRKKAIGKFFTEAVRTLEDLKHTDDEFPSRQARNDLWTDRNVSPKGVRYPKSKWDGTGIFGWATPAPNINGSYPEPWRVAHPDAALVWLKKHFPQDDDIYTDSYGGKKIGGKEVIWVGLRDNRDKSVHFTRMTRIALGLKKLGVPFQRARDNSYILLVDDLKRDVLR